MLCDGIRHPRKRCNGSLFRGKMGRKTRSAAPCSSSTKPKEAAANQRARPQRNTERGAQRAETTCRGAHALRRRDALLRCMHLATTGSSQTLQQTRLLALPPSPRPLRGFDSPTPARWALLGSPAISQYRCLSAAAPPQAAPLPTRQTAAPGARPAHQLGPRTSSSTQAPGAPHPGTQPHACTGPEQQALLLPPYALNSIIMLDSGGRPTHARSTFSSIARCLPSALTTGVPCGTSGAFVR